MKKINYELLNQLLHDYVLIVTCLNNKGRHKKLKKLLHCKKLNIIVFMRRIDDIIHCDINRHHMLVMYTKDDIGVRVHFLNIIGMTSERIINLIEGKNENI